MRADGPKPGSDGLGALSRLVYLTEPWAEKALQVVESDPSVQEAMTGIALSVLTIVLEPPEGRYGFFFTSFDGKGLSEYRVGYDYEAVTRGMDKPTFVVSGPYEVFASIQRGETTERKALLKGKLQLTGSIVKALRHMSSLEAMTRALATIDCAT